MNCTRSNAIRGFNSYVVFLTFILLFISTLAFSQDNILRGKIVDGNGSPIKSAFILNPKKDFAWISNSEGEFQCNISDADSMLLVRKKGYYDKKFFLNGESNVSICLESIKIMDFETTEYLKLGGKENWDEKNCSNSVSHLSLKKYYRSGKGIDDVLQQLPGLTAKKADGQPGSAISILSRGYESLVADEPLIIVDGIRLNSGINSSGSLTGLSDLSAIDLKNIKHIEFLRDGASTAMFGSQGANGVLLIETIKGEKQDFTIEHHTQMGISFPLNGEDMMGDDDYFDLINESLGAASLSEIQFPEDPSTKDWQDEIVRAGVNINHFIAMRGGNEKSNFDLTGNLNYTSGNLKKSNLTNGGIHFNYFTSTVDWFKLGLNLNYSKAVQNSPINNDTQFASNPLVYSRAYAPVANDEVQNITELWQAYGMTDPQELIDSQEGENNASFLYGGLNLSFILAKNLSFHSELSVNYSKYNQETSGLNAISPYWFSGIAFEKSQELAVANAGLSNYLKWHKNYGTSNFSFLFGFDKLMLFGNNELTTTFSEDGTYSQSSLLEAEGENWREINAVYLRMMYAYNERFDFSASFRREAVLNKDCDYNYRLFPAVSTGVWMKKYNPDDAARFSALKLFLGFGMPGADPFLPVYYSDFSLNGSSVAAGETGLSIVAPNVEWEVVEEWNMGFQAFLFDNDLSFKLTYFDRMRDNVAYQSNESVDGVNIPKWNYTGRVNNSGYEMEFDYKKNFKKLAVFANLNMQVNYSTVISLGDDGAGTTGYYFGNTTSSEPLTAFKQGSAPGSFWGYLNEGVKQSESSAGSAEAAGDYNFADLDGNGVIDENDKTTLGSPIPDLHYSFSGGVVFGNYDLTFVFDGETGGEIYNVEKSITEATGGYFNRSVAMENRWSESNTDGNLARVQFNDPNNNSSLHSGMIEDASYLRLQKLELGYNFTSENQKKNRLYLAIYDLFLMNAYDGGSPVFSGVNNYRGVSFGVAPFSTSVVLGLQIGL